MAHHDHGAQRAVSPAPHTRRLTLVLCAASLALAACGGGGDPPEASHQFFDHEVNGHRAWAQLSPERAAADVAVGAPDQVEEVDGTSLYQCHRQAYSLTDTPKEFVSIDPDRSVVWVGSLVQGRSHYQVGDLQELPIRERGPLTVSIDLLRADNARTVAVASKDTVDSAIGDLVERAAAAGFRASSDVYYESREAHSTSQVSLKLGLTGEYLGGAAQSRLEIDKVGAEHTQVAYFVQRAFTVSVASPARPSEVLGTGFDEARLDELKGDAMIGADNPPLFISSIAYGRVLMYKMTARTDSARIAAAIQASYQGLSGAVGGYSEAELRQTLNEARIEIATFGGDVANVEALIRDGNLRSYFTGDTALTAMRPISFELRRLQDRQIAHITRTTAYAVKDCRYVGDTRPPVGESYNVKFVSVAIPADCDAGIDPGDVFGRFDVINTDAAGNRFTNRVLTIARDRSRTVASGNALVLDATSRPLTRYYNQPFEISGELFDADGGLNGGDDVVGRWNANTFDISRTPAGSHSKKASGNCIGRQPTLTYQLIFNGYVY